MTMRVASYNTRDFKDDADAAARVVGAIDPDVLCLQEVPRRAFGGARVADFAARCGLYWSGRHRGSGGTTIFTSLRVQLLDGAHQRLPVRALQRTRGYAVALVALPGHPPLVVASVHLGLDAQERERHLAVVLHAIGARGPAVIAGDLNEDRSGPAWDLLAGSLRLVSPAAPTFPARAPGALLDVVFASPSLRLSSHSPVGLDPGDLTAASDHLPVWADLDAPDLVAPDADPPGRPAHGG